LIHPFIIREAGLIVNDVPRINCYEELNNDSHCITAKDAGLKILLYLRGIFSSFDSRSLTQDEVENCDDYDLVMLMPDSRQWDPYDDVYADNEDSILPGMAALYKSRQ
jgi:hypothetical protein